MVSGQYQTLATLQWRKQLFLSIESEAGWDPEPVWTLWRIEKYAGNRTAFPRSSSPLPTPCNDWDTPAHWHKDAVRNWLWIPSIPLLSSGSSLLQVTGCTRCSRRRTAPFLWSTPQTWTNCWKTRTCPEHWCLGTQFQGPSTVPAWGSTSYETPWRRAPPLHFTKVTVRKDNLQPHQCSTERPVEVVKLCLCLRFERSVVTLCATELKI